MSLELFRSGATPSTPYELNDWCAAIDRWLPQTDSVEEIRDTNNKLASIREYLERTSIVGLNAVAATMRRGEVRIGQLLGTAARGGDRRSDQFDRDRTGLSPDERSQFRRMAEHPEIVEQVIEESTDEEPASRRKVISAIRGGTTEPDMRIGQEATKHAQVAQRSLADVRVALSHLNRCWHQIPNEELTDLARWVDDVNRTIDALKAFVAHIEAPPAAVRRIK